MDILGIGLWEILLILGLAFIILGPQDMSILGRKAGTALRKWMMTDEYREIKRTQTALTNLPRKLMSESGLDSNIIKPPAAASVAPEVKKVVSEKIEDSIETVSQSAAESDDPLSAWAHPGEPSAQKRKAMLDDVKRSSMRAAQVRSAQSEPSSQETNTLISDSDSQSTTE